MATIIVAEREMSKSETQNILYAISETPIWIEYKTKTIVGVKSNRNAKPKAHRFQLLNWATIKADGTIQQASQEFYDAKFKAELNSFKSNNEALLFLDYHFEHTPDKRGLLNRIDTHIIRRYITNQYTDVLLNESRIELVAGWLREKENELPKPKKVREVKLKTGMRESTKKEYKARVKYYNSKKKKYGHDKAVKMTATKFGKSEKTIYRAIQSV